MKAPTFHSLALSVCVAGLLAAPKAVHAVDFDALNPTHLFRKEPDKPAPTDEEKRQQEIKATAEMQEVGTLLAAGDSNKAKDVLKKIVKKYPFTDTAAEAQFTLANLLRKEDKLSDSFEAFGKLVEKFRRSPRFSEAVQAQFELAEEAKSGKKQGGILGLKLKLQTSEILKMYETVVKEAPYGKFAPLAQFAIAELHQEKGEKDEAIAAYQVIVDNYPNTKQAPEAQFRIGSISKAVGSRTEDAANLQHARDALIQYKVNNPVGERVNETESQLNSLGLAQAQRSMSIARFYEKSGKPKAAAIYYNEALRSGSPDAVLKARERLSALASAYGDDIKQPTDQEGGDALVPAAVNLKGRDDYAGPPAPEVAKLGNKKSPMRVDDDNFKPLPIKEPELPGKSDAPAPGMLIPPAPGEKATPGLLPVPPTPDASKPSN